MPAMPTAGDGQAIDVNGMGWASMRASITLSSRATAILASSALSLLAIVGAAGFATAGERVGVTAAVTPKATSKAPGSGTKTLKIGKSVFYNERITTSASGVVQVLLVDGSTFTVGPRSSLVIDKFVYNPSKGTGEMTATLSKGALRFVGGKLSKKEPPVKVKTPAGELTVRGGIFQGIVKSSNQAVFAFVFGDYLALNRKGKRYRIKQSGNLFAIGNAGPPIIRRTTQTDTNLILAAISGRAAGHVYKTKANAWPFYFGIQPSGRYPDQPFVREQFYDNLPIKLHRVPKPKVYTPPVRTPQVVPTQRRPTPEPRRPTPVTVTPRYDPALPGVTACPNC
ncbi:MAG: FecR family protein [Pseudomonadota bacterium]